MSHLNTCTRIGKEIVRSEGIDLRSYLSTSRAGHERNFSVQVRLDQVEEALGYVDDLVT